MDGLSVSGIVNVTVNLGPIAAAVRSFGVLMIAGDSNVISGAERFRSYPNLTSVGNDFGVNAPEYQAAELYFGQTPEPETCMIGRWFSTASSGMNIGAIQSAAQQMISNWTPISSGGFDISIDGASAQTLTGLDFTGVTNLNGVASVINGALTGAVCTWDGTEFIITSNSTGAGSQATGTITLTGNPSYGVQASGTITLTGNPSNGDTVTIKGTAVTFVSGTPSGNQVAIGGSDTVTAASLQTFLQNSADANLAACTYNTIGLVTTITARAYGTAGNSYGLTKSGSNITVSGSGDLAGGVAADTLTVNGTALTFVAASPGANQVLVGATAAQTAGNLQTFLAASSDTNIDKATYATSGLVTSVTAVLAGTAGNSFTLAKSSSSISLSAADLSGGTVVSSVGYATSPGSGTDISTLLGMTAATSQSLVSGYNAESPVQCAEVLADLTAGWYGLMFQASVQPSDSQNLAVSAFIEAQDITRIFGVTITNTNVLSSLVSNDLASLMKNAGYLQSFCQYSSTDVYSVASFFGRAFSVDFTQNNSTICLMFKQEPGVTAETLSESQAATLQAKRCNVFVNYVNDTAIIQYGVMSGSAFFDEIQGIDWLQNAIQTACYNALYTSTTKIPQTDQGVNVLVNAIGGVCQQGVDNGLIAPGTWNEQGFGNLTQGQFLKTGYYIYAQPVALQSEADRSTRVAPPIQVGIKFAGAIQSVDVVVDVNR